MPIQQEGYAQLPELTRRAILRDLFCDPGFGSFVETQARKARNTVLQYLKESDFNLQDRVALIDIGWRGSQQVNLRRIADMGDLKIGVIEGFYLFRTADSPVASLADKSYGFLCDQPGSVASAFYYRYRQVIEAALGAAHSSTRGYVIVSGVALPVLEPDDATDYGIAVQQHQWILSFVGHFMASQGRAGLAELIGLRDVLAKNLQLMLSRPERLDAQGFSDHVFVHCHMTSTHQSVIRVPSVLELLCGRSYDMGVWPEGSIRCFPRRQLLARGLRKQLARLRKRKDQDQVFA
ncbi:MAG: hypothetical protein R6W06_04175 [Prochlorococcaceae cyanobacterium]